MWHSFSMTVVVALVRNKFPLTCPCKFALRFYPIYKFLIFFKSDRIQREIDPITLRVHINQPALFISLSDVSAGSVILQNKGIKLFLIMSTASTRNAGSSTHLIKSLSRKCGTGSLRRRRYINAIRKPESVTAIV